MTAFRAETANRALAIAAMALLFVMPVSARAGLRDPHPHALLQLAMDESDGALDHHAPAAGERRAEPHDHRGHFADPFSLGPVGDDGAAQPEGEHGPSPDVPAASGGAAWAPATAGLVWSFLTILPAAWFAAPFRARSGGLPRATAAPPADRPRKPELPPPRALPGLVAS